MKLSNPVALALGALSLTSLIACGSAKQPITADSSGSDVYAQSCAGCHNGGLKGWMTGAPKVGDAQAWQPLIAKGIEAMTAASIQGFNKMPAKGGCEECSDEQIKAAIEVMVEQSK